MKPTTPTQTIDLATLRFDGKRFEGHALDVECTSELVAYRALVLACAEELWRRKHPQRVRRPKGFDESFRVEFDRVDEGSAAVPLRRVKERVQAEFDFDDEFDEAARLIDAAIAAAAADDLLPEALPASVIPLFKDFGRSLRPEETLFVRSRGAINEAAYNAQARTRLAEWVGPSYEDAVTIVGEVRMANLGPGAFKLQVSSDGPMVDGRFEARHEALVLEALRNHRQVRLRVSGLAEFATHDRQMRRFVRVDDARIEDAPDVAFDEAAPAIWDELAAIGEAAPAATWADVPSDLSQRIDDIAYRQRGDA